MIALFCLGVIASGVLGASLEKRQLTPGCQQVCPRNYNPVCGSDGQTYSNTCMYTNAVCAQRLTGHPTTLHLLHYGACTGHEPGVVSTHQSCDTICNEDLQHVCGSDGVVYKNPCLFQRAQCEAANQGDKLFLVSYNDTCPTPRQADCSRYHLDPSNLALEGGTVQGNTVRCSATDYHYVCSTDGRTFSSECLLCHYLDANPTAELQILHEGPCVSTAGGISGGIAIPVDQPIDLPLQTPLPPDVENWMHLLG